MPSDKNIQCWILLALDIELRDWYHLISPLPVNLPYTLVCFCCWSFMLSSVWLQALKQLPRDKVQLATKFGVVKIENTQVVVNGTPEYVRSCCEASLKRLGVDYIDLYYQHRIDTTVPIEDTVSVTYFPPHLSVILSLFSLLFSFFGWFFSFFIIMTQPSEVVDLLQPFCCGTSQCLGSLFTFNTYNCCKDRSRN